MIAPPVRAAARLACGALVLGGTPVFAAAPATPEPPFYNRWIAAPPAGGKAAVEVNGLRATALQELRDAAAPADRWQDFFAVYAETKGAPPTTTLPPMLGAYRVAGSTIRFEPQFPLQTGVLYRAVFRPDRLERRAAGGGAAITAEFELPPLPAGAGTRVSAIYPSADVLPENLLKFYLHFSAPMSGGHIYERIHLRDERGQNIQLPFLELDEELWNPAMTRLTLLIDPGRIKRGLLSLAEIGPSLREGGRYALVIDREWKDAAGQPLLEVGTKLFRVGPADRTPPDPAQWKLRAPAAGTRGALEVALGEPLDRALALRLIRVVTAGGAEIDGEPTLAAEERQWSFIPDAAWRRDDYRLVIATTIEDLAGNNVGKPFDVDVFERVDRRLTSATVSVPFTVR